jgi:sugar/nucleoside kinase (ribokinase family)
MADPDVIVVGDVMLDVSVEAGALATGGDVQGEVRVRPGGSGANAAVWAACEGSRVSLYGCIGNDLAGRLLQQALGERGVEAHLAAADDARTGSMLVVRQPGERSMVADRGANSFLSPEMLPARLIAGAVLVSGYVLYDSRAAPGARAALHRADAPVVAVDAASWPLLQAYGSARFLDATAKANVLLANEAEAAALGDIDDVARRFEHVFVKHGALGAVWHWRGRASSVASATTFEPVDATGAGDAFDGVLLAALSAGAGPLEAMESACAAGARCAATPENWPSA